MVSASATDLLQHGPDNRKRASVPTAAASRRMRRHRAIRRKTGTMRAVVKKAEHVQRIGELRELLEEANRAYYVDAEPIMPDSEYDALMAELIALEEAGRQRGHSQSCSAHGLLAGEDATVVR